jgi:NitT/TauT family transport system substrate-binding protein
VPGLATLWDKTVGTAHEVRALCAAQAMPFILVTNKPEIKSIKDFKEGDKIAVPGIKNSNQAICLQMAAAKEWGQANYARLDPFTITLPHPDAAIAIISRSTELCGHYGVSPFQDYELAAPGTHAVLKSYDTLGGPTTNGVVFMAKKFRDANPKVTSAVYAAFDEVSAFINKEPRQSAEIYIRMTNEKRSGPDEMAKMISNPDNVWQTTPLNAMRYVEFMNKVGTMKKQPATGRTCSCRKVHELKGVRDFLHTLNRSVIPPRLRGRDKRSVSVPYAVASLPLSPARLRNNSQPMIARLSKFHRKPLRKAAR